MAKKHEETGWAVVWSKGKERIFCAVEDDDKCQFKIFDSLEGAIYEKQDWTHDKSGEYSVVKVRIVEA